MAATAPASTPDRPTTSGTNPNRTQAQQQEQTASQEQAQEQTGNQPTLAKAIEQMVQKTLLAALTPPQASLNPKPQADTPPAG